MIPHVSNLSMLEVALRVVDEPRICHFVLCLSGWGVGNLVGGLAYDALGGRETFRLAGIITMVIGFLHLVASYLVKKSKKSQIAPKPDALEVIEKL